MNSQDESRDELVDLIAGAVVAVLVVLLSLWVARNYEHVAIAVILALMILGRRNK